MKYILYIIYICINIYICMYIYIYINIYILCNIHTTETEDIQEIQLLFELYSWGTSGTFQIENKTGLRGDQHHQPETRAGTFFLQQPDKFDLQTKQKII